jgi:transcription-repair coupling factor (superfamily II helicase)
MAIEQFSMLGAGFKIAMRDLEIRGAGNLLGAEQSGHIAAVGYEMYCRLLEDSVLNLQRDRPLQTAEATTIEVGVVATVPKPYIPSDLRRLEAYRRLAIAETYEAVAKFREDLVAAYGRPPRAVERLMELAELRIACAAAGISALTVRDKDVVFVCKDSAAVGATLQANATGAATTAPVRVLPPKPDHRSSEVYFRPPDAYFEPDTLLRILRRRLGVPVAAAEAAPAAPPAKTIGKRGRR